MADETTPTENGDGSETVSKSQIEQLLEMQKEQRAEIAALRESLAKAKAAPPPLTARAPSAEELQQERLRELAEHSHYCPGCGQVYDYQQRCQGTAEKPHPPIEVVSTDEVRNRPDPENDPAGYVKWQEGHTAAPEGKVTV